MLGGKCSPGRLLDGARWEHGGTITNDLVNVGIVLSYVFVVACDPRLACHVYGVATRRLTSKQVNDQSGRSLPCILSVSGFIFVSVLSQDYIVSPDSKRPLMLDSHCLTDHCGAWAKYARHPTYCCKSSKTTRGSLKLCVSHVHTQFNRGW